MVGEIKQPDTRAESQRDDPTVSALLAGLVRALGAANQQLTDLDTLIESLPAGVLLVDPQGRPLRVNREARRLLSLSDEPTGEGEHTGHHRRGGAASLGLAPALIEQALSGMSVEADFACRRHDTDERLLHAAAACARAPTGALLGAAVVLRDVTGERARLRDLAASEEGLQTLYAALSCGVLVHDPSGSILHANVAAERILGRPAGALRGHLDLNAVREDGSPLAGDEYPTARALSSGEPQRNQTIGIDHPDGERRWLQVDAVPVPDGQRRVVQVVTSFIDITERKRAQEALRESEDRFRTLFNHSTLGIYRTTPEGRIVMANPALVEMLDFSSLEELLAFDLSSDRNQPSLPRHLFKELMEREGEVRGIEVAWTRRNGSHVFVRESARAVRDDAGRTVYYDGTVEDISEHKRMEELATRLGRILDESDQEIYVFDAANYHFLQVNESARRQLGYSREELGRMTPMDLIADATVDDLRALIAPLRNGERQQVSTESTLRRKDGTTYPVEILLELSSHTEPAVYTAIAKDISERRARIEELQHRALYDGLTDLPNRVLLLDRLQQTILIATREREEAALLLMDLDGFKHVNDALGHHYGDLLLQQIGPRLQGVLRDSDTVARLGGDEFAVLLPSTGIGGASLVARKILEALEAPFLVEGQALIVGASIGIAIFPEHGSDSQSLMRRADVAMYLAKRTSSGHAVYASDQDQYSAHRLALLGQLRQGIEHGELVLHYQPQVDLRTQQARGVEALLRWMHPQRGLLSPDEFIPLAENSELIRSVSMSVLEAALRRSHDWRQQGVDLRVAVNLSARNLLDLYLPDAIADLLRRYEVDSSCLELEITESAIMVDQDRAMEVLRGLHEMGIALAIDDFGTGYSSLAYLRQLPVSAIKIDRSFVIEMGADENNAAIVRSTVDLGHNLGLTVVAEGVEDQRCWDQLASLGCDVAQGYFISRALPEAEFLSWLTTSPWWNGNRPA